MFTKKSINDLLLDYIDTDAAIFVAILNQNGEIVDANQHSLRLLGTDDISGIRFGDIVIDFNKTIDLEKLFNEPKKQHLLNIKYKDRLPHTYYFKFYRVDDDITLAVGQQDQQENEEMRTAFLQLNSDLSNLTRDLHKKKAALERLDAQKNQFFGMAAHDIRHPLSVIRMYSEFLETETVDLLEPIHSQFLGTIRDSADLMEDILNDFLDITVFQTGKLKIDRARIDMNEWFKKTVTNCSVLATRKEVGVSFKTLAEKCMVDIDTSKMSQVVYNLLSNGIKFSSPGESIDVRLVRDDTNVTFSVADQGPGIAYEDQPKLFQPFVCLSNSTHQTEKSSGLGLAIVKKIVDAHGGKVWIESEFGKGATFFVSLPHLTDDPTLSHDSE